MDRITFEIESWTRLARIARTVATQAEQRGQPHIAVEAHCIMGEAQREARALAKLRVTT